WEKGGMQEPKPWNEYLSRQAFREGHGYVLNLDELQEAKLLYYLNNVTSALEPWTIFNLYSLPFRNCGEVAIYGIYGAVGDYTHVGMPAIWLTHPLQIESFIRDQRAVTGRHFYPATAPYTLPREIESYVSELIQNHYLGLGP